MPRRYQAGGVPKTKQFKTKKPMRRRGRYALAGRVNPKINRLVLHKYKRLVDPANNIVLGNQSNTPYWVPNSCVAVSLYSPDDFNTYQIGASLQFQLNQVSQYTDFTNLYDRYMITGVKLSFMFQSNISGVSGGVVSPLPVLTYAFDCDDSYAPTGELDVMRKSYAKRKVLNANRPFSIFIKPRIDMSIFQDGVFGAYASTRPKWIDCDNAAVPHYGLKMWIRNWYSVSGDSSYKLTITPTYYLSLRDPQ